MWENIWSEIYILCDIASSTPLDRCNGFVLVIKVVLFWSFRLFRFGPFVLLCRVLVHAEIINDIITNLTFWLSIFPLT